MTYYYWLCFSIVGGILSIGWIPIIWLIGRGCLCRMPAMTKINGCGYQPEKPAGTSGKILPPPKNR